MNSKSILNAIWTVIKKNIFLSFLLFLVIVLTVLTSLVPPLVLEKIIDNLSEGISISLVLTFAYFLCYALSNNFESLKEILLTVFGQKTTHEIRKEMSEKLKKLPSDYFVLNPTGETASRFVNDVDSLESLFTSGIISMFIDCCKVISILFVVFNKSKGLGLILLCSIPLIYALTRYSQKRMLAAQLKNRKAIASANQLINESVSNISSIHVFGKKKYIEDKYENEIEESYKALDKSNFFDAIYSPFILVLSAVIVAISMFLAANSTVKETIFTIGIGSSVAIISYVGKIFDPIEAIGMEIQSIQTAIAAIERVNTLLNEEEKKSYKTVKEIGVSNNPIISIRNITFSYDKKVNILKDFSLDINENEIITIEGRTGTGKSTLFKLLLGLYEVDNGEIIINGIQTNQIDDSIKRKLFGYVEQSFIPVEGTIKDQITLFNPSLSDELVKKALETVGLKSEIDALEKGVETIYKDSFFSQGQKQLLSIARAIATEPKILLLDEITADLDSATEELILNALNNSVEKRTVVSISHRLYSNSRGRTVVIN